MSFHSPSDTYRRHTAWHAQDMKWSLLLLLFSFSVYLSNGRLISAGDTYPARYLPFSLLKYGSLSLDPLIEVASQGHLRPHWIINVDGRAVSTYPVVLPVMLTPV